VGLDFLPRGDGLVTRRPLEMRLIHDPETPKPWAFFFDRNQEKFFDFEKVRKQIDLETDKVAGQNKGKQNHDSPRYCG
jgi:vacuolar protein sorting-associated protein 1